MFLVSTLYHIDSLENKFMLLLRCTIKLLKEVGVKQVDLASNLQTIDPLGSWYANLLHLDRKKCLLFTNEKTLYSFLVPGVKKSDYKDFGMPFRVNLMLNLKFEGFEDSTVKKLLKGYDDYGFTKTGSRSVLGSMNDFADQYDNYIYYFGGIKKFDLMDTNRRVNESPMSALGYDRPTDKFRSALNA